MNPNPLGPADEYGLANCADGQGALVFVGASRGSYDVYLIGYFTGGGVKRETIINIAGFTCDPGENDVCLPIEELLSGVAGFTPTRVLASHEDRTGTVNIAFARCVDR